MRQLIAALLILGACSPTGAAKAFNVSYSVDSTLADSGSVDSTAVPYDSTDADVVATCRTSIGGTWQNIAIPTQIGTIFSVEFDATPTTGAIDGVIGLSNGWSAKYSNQAAVVRFNLNGKIDARNGGGYTASNSYSYSDGVTYHVRMEVSLVTKKYSAFVKVGSGSETQIATNYAFRNEQKNIKRIDNLGFNTSVGSLQTCYGPEAPPLPPPAVLTAIVISPPSATVEAGKTVQFSVTGRVDTVVTSASATYSATGGTITSGGLYTAGSTPGVFRVIATQSSGTLADTAPVTVNAAPIPPPPPSTITYWTGDAESGTLSPPWASWGIYYGGGALKPTNTTARAHQGSRSFKVEVTGGVPCQDPSYCSSSLQMDGPQNSMGCKSGHFCTGWYSAWLYIDAGFSQPTWNVLFNLVGGRPDGTMTDPIGHVGLEIDNGVLQLNYYPKNLDFQAPKQWYPVPTIPGYTYHHYGFWMTPSSPAGIVAFPKNQWVHTAIYVKMAKNPNGIIEIWQNGTMIMHLTGLNTFDGVDAFDNTVKGDFLTSWGMYEGPLTETRRLYFDQVLVTNTRPTP